MTCFILLQEKWGTIVKNSTFSVNLLITLIVLRLFYLKLVLINKIIFIYKLCTINDLHFTYKNYVTTVCKKLHQI